jgi:inner membrane protein involved in colicin E2 resistance
MPLNVRYIGVTIAVICFFCLSFISGLAPFTCCKRAVIGAAVAYVTASLVVKAINAVLINAMIASQKNQTSLKEGFQQEAKHGDSKD